jgi:cob(I)alamin adenosyltransferase
MFLIVIPGKDILKAQIHLARTAARKTERMFFAATEQYSLCQKAGAYLNRLSDYLFVLSQF